MKLNLTKEIHITTMGASK